MALDWYAHKWHNSATQLTGYQPLSNGKGGVESSWGAPTAKDQESDRPIPRLGDLELTAVFILHENMYSI
jgi:hypothetical protein